MMRAWLTAWLRACIHTSYSHLPVHTSCSRRFLSFPPQIPDIHTICSHVLFLRFTPHVHTSCSHLLSTPTCVHTYLFTPTCSGSCSPPFSLFPPQIPDIHTICLFTRPLPSVHTSCSHFLFTPPIHTYMFTPTCSRFLFRLLLTALSISLSAPDFRYSRDLFTPPVHTSRSHLLSKPFTAGVHFQPESSQNSVRTSICALLDHPNRFLA